jgi:hypothetical protein
MTRIAAIVTMLIVAAGASAATKARVWVSSQEPLVVRGVGFDPQERVTVSVTGRDLSTRRAVSATSTGAFVVRFPGTSVVGECGTLFVRAVGAHGTYAVWKRVTECAALQPVDQ